MRRLIQLFAELFESHPSWLIKVGAASALGLLLSLVVVVKASDKLSWGMMIAFIIAFPAFFGTGGALLATADATRMKIRTGQRVGVLARALFGFGIWSLLIWIIVLLPLGFALAIFVGTLTSDRPAG